MILPSRVWSIAIPIRCFSLVAPLSSLFRDHETRIQKLRENKATSVCGLYCRYCTRSYSVGGNTETVNKTPNKPIKARWDEALAYILSNPAVHDVVVSGGDAYYLLPEQLRYIGDQLLDIPHVRRFRIGGSTSVLPSHRKVCPSVTKS